MIALYPGAFKPPHRGHFNVVKSLLDGSYNGSIYNKDNYKEKGAELFSGNSNKKPDINKVIVFVGAGERNGIDKDEALSIWNIYAKYLGNVEILDGGSNPMFAAKDYAQADPETEFVAVTGIRSEEDFVDLRRVTTFKNAPNVQGLALASKPGSGIRATEFRKNILSGNLDNIIDFFPEDLSREEILNILNDLKDKIVAEILSSSIEGFVEEYFTEENRYNKDGYDEGDIKLMGDMILPTDKMVVLQAEEDTYNRGLLVTSNEDKSYDVAYWADDKTKPYPIGIEIDGKEVAKDANIVKFMFHPEMKEEILDENINARIDKLEKLISKIPKVGDFFAKKIDGLQSQVNNMIQTAKEEAGETRDMLVVVGRYLRGETVSGANEAFMKRQLLDLLKISGTVLGIVLKKVPLVGVLGFIIAKLGLTDEVFALSDEDKRTVRGQDDRKAFAGKVKTFNGIQYVPYKDVLPFLKKGEYSVQNEYYQSSDTENLELKDYITSLTEYMLDIGMNITPLPEVKLRKDEAEANNFFGRTAYYDPNAKEIVIYTLGRHDKDIVRSYAHEMIHHMQNLQGVLHNIQTQNTNADSKLLELEKEAYTLGNITFRNWEDSLKN